MSPPEPQRTLRLRVDAAALQHNWRALDRLSGSAAAGAAVKSDCYGLGVDQCVPALRDAGCSVFFVAHWSEVPPLLEHVAPTSIAVLHGVSSAEEARFAIATGVRPVINSIEQANHWHEAGGDACDLMVDTGMNRLGVSTVDLSDDSMGRLSVHTLHSHLACADEDSEHNARQMRAFNDATADISHQQASLANSAGIALGSDYHFDLTRPGLSLYGGIPRSELSDKIRQVAMPEAMVLQRRLVRPGDSVGYNATFTADRDTEVAIISIGYADGYLRSWSGNGALRYQGAALPVLGRVSMDMVALDVTQLPELKAGDWVELPWKLADAAQQSGLSQYELLTLLGSRFDRTTAA